MNNTEAHQQLVDDVLFAVGALPHARCWPQINGLFRPLYREGKVKVGVNGMADVGGIFITLGHRDEPYGRRLEIECKTGGGKLSKDQEKYKAMIEKFHGIYIQARSVEQVLTELDGYR